MNNYILNLLNIKDENIYLLEKIEEKVIRGKNNKLIFGILTYNPNHCSICDVVNESKDDIIKWGFKLTQNIEL